MGLAPMADYTDYPFRKLCKKHGAQFVFTEMISVDSIIQNNDKIIKMLPQKDEKNIGIQLFGNDPDKFCLAVQKIEHLADWIDINAACPVNKVVKKGAGAALLKNPKILSKIVYSLKKYTTLPIGVKVRLGYKEINIEEISKIIQDSGADYIIVHGRTREQFYHGKADRSYVKKLKEHIKIPIGATGDVFSTEDIYDYLNNYKADFVVVARGAIGNPWIFRMDNYIPNLDEQINVCLEHLRYMIEFYESETQAVKKFRKVLTKYFSGKKGVNEIRKNISSIFSYNDVCEIIEKNLVLKDTN
ncbi:hypothetical protein X924_07405 [Petrotoga sp. 9PWA.NaAc.5.4]|nr:hypothetical protein X924_07405 [Petrotoga sp. 9PWA.NaAc.5.4]